MQMKNKSGNFQLCIVQIRSIWIFQGRFQSAKFIHTPFSSSIRDIMLDSKTRYFAVQWYCI